MKKQPFYLLFIIMVFVACGSHPTLESQIVGEWSMYKVYEVNSDVTHQHNPKGDRYIIFDADGNYKSGGDPFGENSGTWEIDEENSVLSIFSDDVDDDSQWHIRFEGDQTIWTGIGTPRQESFKLIHQRIAK
jgi:hypothetical protein